MHPTASASPRKPGIILAYSRSARCQLRASAAWQTRLLEACHAPARATRVARRAAQPRGSLRKPRDAGSVPENVLNSAREGGCRPEGSGPTCAGDTDAHQGPEFRAQRLQVPARHSKIETAPTSV